MTEWSDVAMGGSRQEWVSNVGSDSKKRSSTLFPLVGSSCIWVSLCSMEKEMNALDNFEVQSSVPQSMSGKLRSPVTTLFGEFFNCKEIALSMSCRRERSFDGGLYTTVVLYLTLDNIISTHTNSCCGSTWTRTGFNSGRTASKTPPPRPSLSRRKTTKSDKSNIASGIDEFNQVSVTAITWGLVEAIKYLSSVDLLQRLRAFNDTIVQVRSFT